MRVTMTDAALAGYCARGVKRWFGDHGLDFRAFLRDGIDSDELLSTGDALAGRVVKSKIEREWLDGDPSALIVTIDDMRASQQCSAGSRAFAAKAGLDWQAFLEQGIPAAQLIATGDPAALRVVRDKMERARGRRG